MLSAARRASSGRFAAVEHAIHVGLAEADRSTQEGSVEADVVDPHADHRGAGLAVAEAPGASVLDQRQRPVSDAGEEAQDEPAGDAVLHPSVSRETRADSRRARPSSGAPEGLGKYLACLRRRRSAWM